MKKSIYEKYNIGFKQIREVVEPYIVKFYGQENKEEISKRLDKVVLNNYFSLEDIKSFVRKNKEAKRRSLSLEFLEALDENITFTKEEKEELVYDSKSYSERLEDKQKNILDDMFDNFSDTFSESTFAPIYSCFNDEESKEELTDYQKEDIKNKTCKVLNLLGLDINNENYDEIILKESSEPYIHKAKALKETALNLRDNFFEFSSQFYDEEEYFKECDKLKQDLSFKEVKDYYKEILPYATNAEKENITKALNMEFRDVYHFLEIADKNTIYLKSSLALAGKIESLSKESKKSVLNKKSFFKDQILKEQKECLSSINGGNPNGKIVPSEEIVEEIKNIREKHMKNLEKEMYLKTSSYENSIEKIERLNLKLKDEFNLEFMKNGVVCCCPNVTEEENVKCLMHLPLYNDEKMIAEYKDTMIIHEILHTVELTGKRVDEKTYEFKSGFDIFEEKVKENKDLEKIDDIKEERENRAVELFSENIHQRNAMEIAKMMHEDNVYLFNDPYTAKIKGGTTYEYLNVVTNDFYKNYQKEINEARFEDSIISLTKTVGEDNFYALNNVVNEYAKIPYITMCRDLSQGKKTELTEKNMQLYKKSEEICESMEQFKRKENGNKKIEDIEI